MLQVARKPMENMPYKCQHVLVFEDELSEDNQQSLLEIFAVILEELRKYCYLTLSPLQRSPRITLRGKRMDGYTDSNMLSLTTI